MNDRLTIAQQTQFKELWQKYRSNSDRALEQKQIEAKHESLQADWQRYKAKILEGSFSLDDYTNIKNTTTATMPGGYLCNFLDRDTSKVYGSSKPGTAVNFGLKLNSNKETYTIYQKGKNIENASREEALVVFESDVKPLLTDALKATTLAEKIQIIEKRATCIRAKQILRKFLVLDHVLDFFYVYSNGVIDELYEMLVDEDDSTNLAKNQAILQSLIPLFGLEDRSFFDMYILTGFLWRYCTARGIADVNSPNVILYGPPGTGKTYSVINSLDFVCQGDTSKYQFVQFHPSYTYEDFIEGIRPKGVTENGNIKFELVNGVFKAFCMRAKKDPDNDYYFVIDEINRANLSAVFGEILFCLEKDYRHDVKANATKNLIKTQYASLIEQLGEAEREKLAYEIIDGEVYFGVPKNVFFIGMMNDVDKSIDAFDLALRRRFKWIRKDCSYEVIEKHTQYKGFDEYENIKDYVKACEKLNNYISDELGLGKSYEFGHAFFLKMNDIARKQLISKDNIQLLFNRHLRPTLKEYLRAVYTEKELEDKLQEALGRFKSAI